MKISMISICGEADHPLLPQFRKHYEPLVDQLIIQMGVVKKWHKVNGDTSGSGLLFEEKVEQQNAALEQVDDDTDYLFYFDVDEFISYRDYTDIVRIITHEKPQVMAFRLNNFWKWDNYIGIGGDGWAYDLWARRVFRYEPGMYYTTHRPPTLFTKTSDLMKVEPYQSTIRPNHYSYVYEEMIRRKLLYYNQVYPNMSYMEWFENVWKVWTPENREELESRRSVHPSCAGATTVLFTGQHQIEWQQKMKF